MVQLKGTESSVPLIMSVDFNSSVVQLKVLKYLPQMQVTIYFNSSVVQLKVERLIKQGELKLFQFLSGTIKSYYTTLL